MREEEEIRRDVLRGNNKSRKIKNVTKVKRYLIIMYKRNSKIKDRKK